MHIRLSAVSAFAVAASTAAAADVPFWGCDPSATNRAPAAAANASPSGGFESRICVVREKALPSFTSERRGVCIIMR